MLLRVTFFVLMALGLLGFGAVAWVTTRPASDPSAQAAKEPMAVLAAAHPLRAGTLLKPEDLVARMVSRQEAGPDITPDTQEARRALIGAMVRRGLSVHDVLRAADVMRPGDHGFLAAVLNPGMRAISVGVDAVSGSDGLIWPGDRVDVILTQSLSNPAAPPARRIAAETVLQDVRVIAIDQQLVQGVAPEGNEGKARTVTMEVTATEAEAVEVASRMGRLSLSVVAAAGSRLDAPAAPVGTTWAGDVSPALESDAPSGHAAVVRVFSGSGEAKEFHF
jgi:pilus assembly protein CpaB